MNHDLTQLQARLKENNDRAKMHKQLPFLVSNVVEVSDWTEGGGGRTLMTQL